MKYIVLLSDGMAGRPLEELGGRTTLEAAETPVMDRLAAKAEIGMAAMVPEGMAPGSDTANLSVLGYDPKKYYTGRSPLEALSIGAEMGESDVSFRCNLVTLTEEKGSYGEQRILDHSSGEISTEESGILLDALKRELDREGFDFYRGTSYRHLLICRGGRIMELTAPHDILASQIGPYLPEDPVFREMMEKSYEILKVHPINTERKRRGLNPANSAWFWGAGTKPSLSSFRERTGKRGAMISAVDLLKGIAAGTGMDNITVEGATGGLHTNYEGKADAAVKALLEDGYDFVYVHVEAPDEMGHLGSAPDKVAAIENVDGRVLGRMTEAMDRSGEDYRIMVLPDHPTPVCVRTHTSEPVPYLIYDSRKTLDGGHTYNEKEAAESGIVWKDGHCLLGHLLEL